jgi:hypothetical protein
VSTAASHALRCFFRRDETLFPMEATVDGVTYVHTFTRYGCWRVRPALARLVWWSVHDDWDRLCATKHTKVHEGNPPSPPFAET